MRGFVFLSSPGTSRSPIKYFNANNSPAYVDMVSDMLKLGNGVFTCTVKIDNGDICDYLVLENGSYVDSASSKTD